MSSRFHKLSRVAALAALTTLSSQALAQSDDQDPELRIQRLEEQLRQLTGQNEELQYRNRQLEERLRQLGGGASLPAAQSAPQPGMAAAAAPASSGTVYAQPQAQPTYAQPQAQPGYGQPQPGYGQPQIAAPAPIMQEPTSVAGMPRRGDAFDPSQNPNAPGAPRPLGGGQMPLATETAVGAPGGRAPGEPLNLANTAGTPSYQQGNPAAPPPAAGGLVTAPPSGKPRDEYDLGIGYMQRRDYALAEQTMRNFVQKFPADPLVGDSQYWLGESYFQRQQYRDAAEAFLAVTTKYEKSSKAPDALLRLGQSLAALKEKEAACAAFGEVMRKYPRASTGVKAAVDREQKKEKC